MINEMREKIRVKLAEAYQENSLDPIILTTTYPAGPSGNKELEEDAKKRGSNGIVYIGRLGKKYGTERAGVYSVNEPYLVLIFTNSKNDDTLINQLHDVARQTLWGFTTLVAENVSSVKSDKSGLFCAWIQVNADGDNFYMGESLL